MLPSSSLCRSQQAVEQERAGSAELDNVRNVAERAALAWSRQAYWAERREHRKKCRDRTAISERPQQPDSAQEFDRALSENPDRGHSDR